MSYLGSQGDRGPLSPPLGLSLLEFHWPHYDQAPQGFQESLGGRSSSRLSYFLAWHSALGDREGLGLELPALLAGLEQRSTKIYTQSTGQGKVN